MNVNHVPVVWDVSDLGVVRSVLGCCCFGKPVGKPRRRRRGLGDVCGSASAAASATFSGRDLVGGVDACDLGVVLSARLQPQPQLHQRLRHLRRPRGVVGSPSRSRFLPGAAASASVPRSLQYRSSPSRLWMSATRPEMIALMFGLWHPPGYTPS